MTKIQKTLLLLVLLLLLLLYFFWDNKQEKRTIKIEPIKIAPINIEEKNIAQEVSQKEISQKEVSKPIPSETILSQLKRAVQASTENLTSNKENEQNKIITNLQQTIKQQELNRSMLEKEATLPTKIVEKKVAKNTVTKKIKTKKEESKKIVKKKVVTKTEPKVVQVKPKIHTKRPTITKVEHLVKQETKVLPKAEAKQALVQASDKPNFSKKLSREEEVALYQNQYADTLEVVNVSESFEIEEPDNHLPDAHYFEPIETVKEAASNAPLKFVEKLGVVEVSNKYESNFTISEKIELAEEGIVDISTASLETEELKALDFVDTLEVIEVSEDFETTKAKAYLEE